MKILVIGGTNFIGLNVVRQLVDMRHEVTVFNRGETKADLPKEVKKAVFQIFRGLPRSKTWISHLRHILHKKKK